MPTKTKKKSAAPPAFFHLMKGQKRAHTEQYRFEDDLSIPHSKQPRILRYVSISTGRSEYINASIFGEDVEFPRTISITVEW